MPQQAKLLPVLPLKNTVVYPQIIVSLAVGRAMSLAAVNAAMASGREVITVAQRDPDALEPTADDLFETGTRVTITRVEQREGGSQIIVQGQQRVRLQSVVQQADHLVAEAIPLPTPTMDEEDPDAPATSALLRENLELSQRIALLFDQDNGNQIYQQLVGSLPDPITQMYRIASLANLDLATEQAVLECDTSLALMQKLHEILNRSTFFFRCVVPFRDAGIGHDGLYPVHQPRILIREICFF